MTPITLTIRYSPQPLRDTAAWFIDGEEPADWLAEVAGWGVTVVDLTLFAVPKSAHDLSPMGALVTAPAKIEPAVSSRVIRFGRVAGRIYLPVEAVLSPPVGDSELAALLGTAFDAFIWHPVVGLVGFEPGEGRSFAQLLAPPPRVEADWGAAHPGLPLNQRLRSVTPTEVPSAMQILAEGRGDIGTQNDSLSQLPKLPDESSPGMLTRMGAGAIASAAQAGQWMLDFLPHTASGPTWADRLQAWLAGVGESAKSQMNLLSARERELQRLLGLLANDPDQGLKFALPFGGEAHRGLAAPSGQLAPRDVNFSLDRLQGGGPADFWDVPPHIQRDLLREYRRLAERELKLGRHRRAAYIFAELVGDLAGAAGALVAGGHYREAAVLYRDRLKQPLEAARCLEQGRLWAEALEAYEALHEFEKAGDLARKLEQEEDAQRFFRLKVSASIQQDDFLSAARVLDQKLDAHGEALEQLQQGWHSIQQKQCIGEAFRLWGRLGRHEEAGRQLERFAGSEFSSAAYRNFIDELAEVSHTYPDPLVRASTADTVRVMAAARLKGAIPDESRTLLAAVRRLAPEDRLLDRDCQRYLGQAPRIVRQPPPAVRQAARVAVLVKKHRVAEMMQCFSAAASGDCFYVAGYGPGDTLTVVRGYWVDVNRKAKVTWALAASAWHAPVILVPEWTNRIPAGLPLFIVHLLNVTHDNLRQMSFPADDLVPYSVAAGSPPWATENTMAIAEGGNGTAWALNRTYAGLVLGGYSSKGVPVASQPIELPAELFPYVQNPPVVPVPMQVRESTFYIALGDHVVIVHRDRPVEFLEMPHPIRGLACSPPHTRRRVAVTFDNGGRVFWDESPERHEESFASDLAFPVAGFTRSGWLVAAASDECEVYSTSERRIRLEAECKLPHLVPIAVLDTGASHEFAVCFAEGTILTFQMPPR